MLLGRPVLEQLGAVVDFGSGKMRILGGRWIEIERGKQDAMLLQLAATFNSIEDFENPQFDLRAKDDDCMLFARFSSRSTCCRAL